MARAHAEAAIARASEPRQPLALLAAHRALGELGVSEGGTGEAALHLDTALALAQACAAPYERALTLLALAELRAAGNDRQSVAALLGEARALLTPLGATPALTRADNLAAAPGALPNPLPSRPSGLSKREAEVLRLLAAGRSNREIAAALFLSPRTVQRHVANAYVKIGAHNKADATAYALRRNLS
jgi:DNA-binding CsgD family transcriptional regulator